MLPVTIAFIINIVVAIFVQILGSLMAFDLHKIFEFPWSFSLLVIPVTFSTHVWFKLAELSSTQTLSYPQLLSLCDNIKIKLRVVKISILFYILTAVLSVLISHIGEKIYPWFLGIALGAIIASAYLFISIIHILSEVSDFKMELDQKAILEKNRKDALEKLGKEKSNFQSDDRLDSYNKITSL